MSENNDDPRLKAAVEHAAAQDASGASREIAFNNLSAAERLTLSRERMRQALIESSSGRSRKRSASDTGGRAGSAFFDGLSSVPGVGVLVEAVRGWWSQHPMRLATLVATDAAKTFVRPLAKNNPVGLILGALAFGAVLAWAKPWRGLLKPALFAGLMPQIVSRAMAHVPIESWISALMAMAAKPGSSAHKSAKPEAANPPADPAAARRPDDTSTNDPSDHRPPHAPVH